MRGPETERSHNDRMSNGFYSRFMKGTGLDIGFKGSIKDAEPVLPSAVGVDRDYPGYDGNTLPFPSESQDYVFTSHVLEHISNPTQAIKEWFRVLRTGGHLILIVPHQFLYEKKASLPSRWNGDHKRFYSASKLMNEVEGSLVPNSYRLVHMRDNDDKFNYSIPPERHSSGAYEIECVIKKIELPKWEIK